VNHFKGGIAFAVGLTIAASALGQTVSGDASALRRRLTEHLLSMLDYKPYTLQLSKLAESAFPPRSACQALWQQVVDRRLAQSEPLFRQVVAEAIPETFSPSEIKTGVSLMDGPVGELVRLGGQTPRPTVSPDLIAAADKQLRATPGAEAFRIKLGSPRAFPNAVARDFANRFGPLASADFAKAERATGLKCHPT